MRKYKAIINFEVKDEVDHGEVFAMLNHDLESGNWFVNQSEKSLDHIQNIKVEEVALGESTPRIYCPRCGASEGEVVADDFSNPGFVYCNCHACNHDWIMNDPAKKEEETND